MCEWVTAHIWTRHGTQVNVSWHTCEGVIAHMRRSHGTQIDESWHTYKFVMEQIWMTHDVATGYQCTHTHTHTHTCTRMHTHAHTHAHTHFLSRESTMDKIPAGQHAATQCSIMQHTLQHNLTMATSTTLVTLLHTWYKKRLCGSPWLSSTTAARHLAPTWVRVRGAAPWGVGVGCSHAIILKKLFAMSLTFFVNFMVCAVFCKFYGLRLGMVCAWKIKAWACRSDWAWKSEPGKPSLSLDNHQIRLYFSRLLIYLGFDVQILIFLFPVTGAQYATKRKYSVFHG